MNNLGIKVARYLFLCLAFLFLYFTCVYATPSTHIWAPSTDIQPYKKVHITADTYTPVPSFDTVDNRIHVQQVYGLTFSLLSDKPEDNLLGKIYSPLGKVMVETGFDYKKGFGNALDTYPWYFYFKAGVGEDAYFKNMPAFAAGIYDLGMKHNISDYNVAFFKLAKTIVMRDINLGRFSAGYFRGNPTLLLDKEGLRDNHGAMFAWERTMTEISDKLWVCVDYQGTESGYGAMNYGFAWAFTKDISLLVGYDAYNNRNFNDTITAQLDINF